MIFTASQSLGGEHGAARHSQLPPSPTRLRSRDWPTNKVKVTGRPTNRAVG